MCSSDLTMLHIAAGRMEPVGALSNVDRLLPQYDRADPTRVPAFVGAYAVMVNTNLVTPQQEPKTWLDLLDPKWNGKTLIDDPRAAGGGGAFFQAVSILHTDDFHMRLARNAPTFTRDPGAAERRVARGEYAIWLPAMIASMQGLQGLPVRFLAPEAAVPSIRMDLTRLSRSPHPNAARLFIDHFLSEEFQTELARLGLLPTTHGAADALPQELWAFARAKLLGGLTPDTQEQRLKRAAEIYK